MLLLLPSCSLAFYSKVPNKCRVQNKHSHVKRFQRENKRGLQTKLQMTKKPTQIKIAMSKKSFKKTSVALWIFGTLEYSELLA